MDEKRIVVGIDGSVTSRRALRWAIDEARVHGARVAAVHVWQSQYHLAALSPLTAPFPAVTPEMLERAARLVLDDTVNAVDARGVDVERRLVQGGAARELLDAAKDADLLVVGTHGRGGFAGMLLGSVSQHVTHHAPCPVVLVPEP
jgi:nucleotide-binding universal stress UspA family protein